MVIKKNTISFVGSGTVRTLCSPYIDLELVKRHYQGMQLSTRSSFKVSIYAEGNLSENTAGRNSHEEVRGGG